MRRYLTVLAVSLMLIMQMQSVVHAFEHLDEPTTTECIDCPALKHFQYSLTADTPCPDIVSRHEPPLLISTPATATASEHDHPIRAPPAR